MTIYNARRCPETDSKHSVSGSVPHVSRYGDGILSIELVLY